MTVEGASLSLRHCERSEAIRLAVPVLRYGLLRCARNDADRAVGIRWLIRAARIQHVQHPAHKSCRVSLPCGTAGRTGAFFAGVSPPVSAITETETTRSTMASTSLRSHWPSDNFVSRSFSRMV